MNEIVKFTDNMPVIESKIDINMQELVSVGLAKMETRFTQKIKDLNSEVKILKGNFTYNVKEMDDICEGLIPENFISIKDFLNVSDLTGYKAHISSSHEEKQSRNFFILELKKLNVQNNQYYNHSTISLKVDSIELIESQTTLLINQVALTALMNDKNLEIVIYRRRMGNINKLERQIRARITEAQLNKTERGQELLASFKESFEDDLRALE